MSNKTVPSFGKIMFHFIGICIFQWFWAIPLGIHLYLKHRANNK
jgi:hypothetical protein